MAANVFYLHGQPAPVAQFLRVGVSGHRQLEVVLASGRLPCERVIIDGAGAPRQLELINALRESGRELVLDTNVAELSVVGRFDGAAKAAPWAYPGGVLRAEHLTGRSNHDALKMIARFVVQHGFHAVQAPTHFVEGSTDPWLTVDRESCGALRRALDVEGGTDIAIDYSLMTGYSALRDPAQRRAFISALRGLPIDYLFLRASGFGADASPIGLRRYIAAVSDFQRLERPVIADGVGGLAALAIAAFGAASGVAHGVAEKERFDASSWNKPRKDGGGGTERRVLIAGLDRLLTVRQADSLMAAPGGRKLFSCNDPSCCAHGWDSTEKDPKAHYLTQRARQFHELSHVPEARRVRHFLDKDLADADRFARKAARLKVADESLSAMLQKASVRLEKMGPVLEDLHETIGDDAGRSPPTRHRASKMSSISASRRY